MKFLVIQHVDCEGPGYYARTFEDAGVLIETINLHHGETLDLEKGFDAVITMGGPMFVSERHELSWMQPEIDFLAAHIEAGTPILGICLGHQLLAIAAGAKVKPMLGHEFGFLPVMLTDEGRADPLFKNFPEVLEAVHWHSQMASLPKGAAWLAISERCALQAFRINNAYGVQFHLEITPVMATEWVNEYVEELAMLADRYPNPASTLIDEVFRHEKLLETHGKKLAENFMEFVKGNKS